LLSLREDPLPFDTARQTRFLLEISVSKRLDKPEKKSDEIVLRRNCRNYFVVENIGLCGLDHIFLGGRYEQRAMCRPSVGA
jgi:hypothetical protein